MGSGISQVAAAAGFDVLNVDTSRPALDRSLAATRTSLAALAAREVKKGTLTADAAAARVDATLARIRALGCQCGLVLNPGTPAAAIEPLLGQVDLVLVMTVQPGFGGQAFRRDMLPKLREIAAWRQQRGLNFRLEVDGGIDLATAAECRAAGADTFVAGTSFFRAADRAAFVAAFNRMG